MPKPADMMLDVELDNGWKVVGRVARQPSQTGASFSTGYIAEAPTGERAFLKAFDLSTAINQNDPTLALNALTAAYLYERDLLLKCRDGRLSRVVTALEHGNWRPPCGTWGLIYVPFLIFELAVGDVREPTVSRQIDLAWKLRTMHQVAVAMYQLHSHGIAHEDLKPSNVLQFPSSGSKVADLGCAASQTKPKPEGSKQLGGDPQYAPPEVLFRSAGTDWSQRCARDLYHLGSMLFYFFTGVGTSELVVKALGRNSHPRTWKGPLEDAYLLWRSAFATVVPRVVGAVPEELKHDIAAIARQLCEPDPGLRGLPSNRRRGMSQYDLRWYVSHFDLLARKVELGIVKQRFK